MPNEPYYRTTGDGEKDSPTQFCPEKPSGPDPISVSSDPEGSETRRHSQLYGLDKDDGLWKPLCWKDGKLAVDTEIGDATFTVTPLGDLVNEYDDAPSVAIGVATTIVQFLVPVGRTFYLKHVEFSGENYAVYKVKVDGTTKATNRLFDGKGLTDRIDWEDDGTPGGLAVAGGALVIVEVTQNGLCVSDHEGRIYGRLV